MTHFYGSRLGIRHMTGGLKVRHIGFPKKYVAFCILISKQVYYLPVVPFYNKAALPTILGSVPVMRHIFK